MLDFRTANGKQLMQDTKPIWYHATRRTGTNVQTDNQMGRIRARITQSVGVLLSAGAAVGTPWVISKLYSGRGSATPIRAALLEQPLVALLGILALLLGLVLAIRPQAVAGVRTWLNPRWVWRERRGEAALLLASTLRSLGVCEIASRALYARQYALPLTYALEELVYPPLNYELRRYSHEKDNVLLLGGSVLWSAGARDALQEGLPECTVYNVAQTGHSSLDSLNKYLWLVKQGFHFDYVILCHGINDTRANNAPPDVFQADYDHYSFYQITHTIFRGKRPVLRALLHSMAFYRVYHLWATLRQTETFGRRYLHVAYPREDWLQYGGDLRSAASFEANSEEIAQLARNDKATLLVTFFPYNPALDYWVEGRPGYTEEAMVRMTEQWGLPRHVRAGILAHNAVIEKHRNEYVYVDSTKQLMATDANFVDPCHFTESALMHFIEILQTAIRDARRRELPR